jgi:hypothetical protein
MSFGRILKKIAATTPSKSPSKSGKVSSYMNSEQYKKIRRDHMVGGNDEDGNPRGTGYRYVKGKHGVVMHGGKEKTYQQARDDDEKAHAQREKDRITKLTGHKSDAEPSTFIPKRKRFQQPVKRIALNK